jgi:hypothetical protein
MEDYTPLSPAGAPVSLGDLTPKLPTGLPPWLQSFLNGSAPAGAQPPATSILNNMGAQRQYQTNLSLDDEQRFQAWVKAKNVPWRDEPAADYDMRGFWKALTSGDPRARQAQSQFDGRMHFPDTWKTPYHKTLSNESMYAAPGAPHWVGDRLVDKNGRIVADETPSK